MASRFSGMTVLVSGGTGGLGRAVSLAFLAEDANVVVTYRKQDEFLVLKREAGAATNKLSGHIVDVTDEAQVRELVDQIVSQQGRLDVLVNTVGAFAGGTKLWESDSKVFDTMLDLNLRSGYVLSKSVVPVMLQQKQGAIVNIASKAAVEHAAGAFAYVASKAAAVAMMDSLAEDLKGTGVRVNSVLPSIIDTEANRRAMPKADFAKWPKPDQLARVVLFLCSEDAAVIHGASLPVYGSQ